MPIFRGDVYWVLHDALGGVPHPYVIVQDDVFNHSRIE
ncbi:MAG: type II toxin-antitoxin system PemK/MazF family toxin, partial [Anaerolineae bacterium]|nr:type II toxin-antitoxin system PemK/MazF family toxin [Anaerolineae bacterium]